MDDVSAPEQDPASARVPESYFWPLVALIRVILPQGLLPARMCEGPVLIVPVIEEVVHGCCWVWRPDQPGPRAARPLILRLFAALVLANTSTATRLVIVVLRTRRRRAPGSRCSATLRSPAVSDRTSLRFPLRLIERPSKFRFTWVVARVG